VPGRDIPGGGDQTTVDCKKTIERVIERKDQNLIINKELNSVQVCEIKWNHHVERVALLKQPEIGGWHTGSISRLWNELKNVHFYDAKDSVVSMLLSDLCRRRGAALVTGNERRRKFKRRTRPQNNQRQ
jgi:hypothetical protein